MEACVELRRLPDRRARRRPREAGRDVPGLRGRRPRRPCRTCARPSIPTASGTRARPPVRGCREIARPLATGGPDEPRRILERIAPRSGEPTGRPPRRGPSRTFAQRVLDRAAAAAPVPHRQRRGSQLSAVPPRRRAAPRAWAPWTCRPARERGRGVRPGDGTLTAWAGASMDVAAATVAEGGHRITPASAPAGSTLGGVLASGRSGPGPPGPARRATTCSACEVLDGNGTRPPLGRPPREERHGLRPAPAPRGARGIFGTILEAACG